MKNISIKIIDSLREATQKGCAFMSFLYTTKGTEETSRYLINFGIDEFINPRLRAAGLSARQRRRVGLARRPRLGFTPVLRQSTVDPKKVS